MMGLKRSMKLEKEALSANSPSTATSERFLFDRTLQNCNTAAPSFYCSTATLQNFNGNFLDDPGQGKQTFSIVVELFPSLIDLFRGKP